MKPKSIFFKILFLCLFSTTLTAQDSDPYQLLQRIAEAYQANQLLTFDLEIHQYAHAKDPVPQASIQLSVKQKGHNYWIQTPETEMLHLDGHFCLVNHAEQHIFYQREGEQAKQAPLAFGIDLEFLQQLSKTQGLHLRLFDAPGPYQLLRFEAPEHSQTRLELLFHQDTHLLQQVDFTIEVDAELAPFVGELPITRFQATYTHYSIADQPFPVQLDHFIRQSNGLVQLHPKYGDFDLIMNE